MNRRQFLGFGLVAVGLAGLANAAGPIDKETIKDRNWKIAKITDMPIVLETYTDCSTKGLVGFTTGEREAPKICLTDIAGRNPRVVRDGVFWGFDGDRRFITKDGENVVSYDLNGEDKRVLFTPREGYSGILFGRVPETRETYLGQLWQPHRDKKTKPRLLVCTVLNNQVADVISQDGQQPHACKDAMGELKVTYDVQSADGADSNGICVWQERGVENRYLQPGNGRGFRERRWGLSSPRYPAFITPDLIFFQATPIGKKEPTIYSLNTEMDNNEVGMALHEGAFITAQRPRPGPKSSVIVAGKRAEDKSLVPYILYRGNLPQTEPSTDKGSF